MTPLEELRIIGLAVELREDQARRLWSSLLLIEGRRQRENPTFYGVNSAIRELYDAIATIVVTSETPDKVLEVMIPNMVEGFHTGRQWPFLGGRKILDSVLIGCVTEWKGKKLQLQDQLATKLQVDTVVAAQSVGLQIELLRQECRWTMEKLANVLGCETSTVNRHINEKMSPSFKMIGAYERVFSKALKRQVTIRITPMKRP